jgi:hypothetical protein
MTFEVFRAIKLFTSLLLMVSLLLLTSRLLLASLLVLLGSHGVPVAPGVAVDTACSNVTAVGVS